MLEVWRWLFLYQMTSILSPELIARLEEHAVKSKLLIGVDKQTSSRIGGKRGQQCALTDKESNLSKSHKLRNGMVSCA